MTQSPLPGPPTGRGNPGVPEIIMTEEMRNPKAISTAFETASTGHRGVGYPHTITAISTKNSII